jgi:hypothetical protein
LPQPDVCDVGTPHLIWLLDYETSDQVREAAQIVPTPGSVHVAAHYYQERLSRMMRSTALWLATIPRRDSSTVMRR